MNWPKSLCCTGSLSASMKGPIIKVSGNDFKQGTSSLHSMAKKDCMIKHLTAINKKGWQNSLSKPHEILIQKDAWHSSRVPFCPPILLTDEQNSGT